MGMLSPRRKDGSVETRPVLVTSKEDSPVKESFKDQTDINKIVARYEKTGMLDHVDSRQPLYIDVSEVGDFQSMRQKVVDAEQAFMTLPALVRERFGNDVVGLLQFLQDEKNREEAVKLGLVPDKKAPASEPKVDPPQGQEATPKK